MSLCFCHSLSHPFHLLLFKKSILNLKMGMIEQLPDTLNWRFIIIYLRLCFTNHNILFPCVGFSASIWKLMITRMSLYIVIIMSVQKLCEYSYITLSAHLILPGMFLPVLLDPHLVFVWICWFAHEYWTLKNHLPLIYMHLFSFMLAKTVNQK